MPMTLAFIWRIFFMHIDVDLGNALLDPRQESCVKFCQRNSKRLIESLGIGFYFVVLHYQRTEAFETVFAGYIVDDQIRLKVRKAKVCAVLRTTKAFV